ncbi:DUF4012 domain-containing protein [Candidatus Uhrbacteria bacterium]|nr:DUF4012 domain-containing protein [Candidatus Uhrbacteria bacterium]
MPKKVARKTTKRAVTRRKKTVHTRTAPLLQVAPEELVRAPELHAIELPQVSAPRERKVLVRVNAHPPVSPYVIDFRQQQIELPNTAGSVAPTLAEEASPVLEEAPSFVIEESRTPSIELSSPPVPILEEHALEEIKTDHKLRMPKIRLPHLGFPRLRLPALRLAKPKLPVTSYRLPITRGALRPALAFALIASLFVLPATGIKAYTKLDETREALIIEARATLGSIELPQSLEELPAALSRAEEGLTLMKRRLDETLGALASVLPLVPRAGSAYRSGRYLLDAGTHLTEAGQIVADGFSELGNTATPLTTRLVHFEEALRAAAPLLQAAALELDHVNTRSLPASIRPQVASWTGEVGTVRTSVTRALELLPALETFLGLERTARYLVVFQNPNELRATGGFIGSFALIDIDRGEAVIRELPGGGSYDLQGTLREHVIAPEPLQLIEPHWQFHDANWFPDFPTSAKKLMWFYEKSGGPTVDGVIAVNATLVPHLLALFGPIEMPAYGRTFTAENFIEETQKIVELEYDRVENKPKKLIGELAPILIERILTAEPALLTRLLGILGESLDQKEVQLFTTDSVAQDAFSRAGWTGELHDTDGDYLYLVSTNIAGGKTSSAIRTDVRDRVSIAPHGSITHRLDITRTHTGTPGDPFTGVRNVEYLRVYVPTGSELVEVRGFERPAEQLFDRPAADYQYDTDLARIATGFGVEPISGTDVYREFGKTVFGNWTQLDPGETHTVHLTYRLPTAISFGADSLRDQGARILGAPKTAPYTLLIEKQAGFTPTIDTEIIFPADWKSRWQTGGTLTNSQLAAHTELTGNRFVGIIFEQ